jgi:transcription antitermination factor NusB
MCTRRQARKCALQMLYAVDKCGMPADIIYSSFDEYLPKSENYRIFAISLFKGVCEKIKDLDATIKKYAKNWEIERMAAVDRNIIRIAAYEILATPDIPINVIIDEAVEISKKYSTEDSSKFVNGILDKLKIMRTSDEYKEAQMNNRKT